MTALGEILRRFRFHGVPGAPAAAGVPADRSAELETELEPVFSALEEAQHHALTLVEAAEHNATRSRAVALEEGRRLVSEALARTAQARAEAATARLVQAREERSRLLAAARAEADRIERVSTERAPALARHVVREVLAFGSQHEMVAVDVTGTVDRDDEPG